jgi:hypothetical protein
MPAGEFFCPHCGYNVRGIPEIRCPECGFGFDLAAIHSLATATFACRLANYRRMVRFAALSVACSVLAAAMLPGILGDIVCGTVLISAFLLHLWLSLCGLSWASLGSNHFDALGRFFGMLFVVPLAVLLGLVFPMLAMISAAVMLVLPLLVPLASSPGLPESLERAELSLPPARQRTLQRWRWAGWLSICSAVGVLVSVVAAHA